MTDTTSEHFIRMCARAAHKAKLCVVPVKEDGSKAPDLASWREYQKRRPTAKEINAWWPTDSKRTGIGIIMGSVSGNAECIDFDSVEVYKAAEEMAIDAGAKEIWNRIVEGYLEKTPNGMHMVFRCEDEVPGSQKLAQRECPGKPECSKPHGKSARPIDSLIETKGEGGFIVAGPSFGSVHESEKSYHHYQGSDYGLATLTAKEREIFIGLMRAFDEMPVALPASADPNKTPADDSAPGSLYNADPEITMESLLAEHGWAVAARRGDVTYMRRPGKDRGVSATIGKIAPGILRVFTTSTEFDSKSYDQFGAYAVLEHGGDHRSAAMALRQAGYAGAPPERLGAPRQRAPGLEVPRSAPNAVKAADGDSGAPAAPYDYRSVFGSEHWVGQYIDFVSQRNDAAHEYHEALGTSLLAAMLPGVRIKLSAWPRGLSANMYLMIVGDTSISRKSTAINEAREILSMVDNAAIFPDRFTPEALLEQLAMRARVPSVWYPDELGQVLEDATNRPPVMDAMLTLYDSPRQYDYARHSKRVRGASITQEDHDRVQDPHWSIIGSTTPDIFDGLNMRAVRSGLLPRFAIVWPQQKPPRMGLRRETPKMASEQWALAEYLKTVLAWSTDNYGEIEIQISDTAIEIIDAYQEETESKPSPLTARLPPTALKLSIVSAVGEAVPRVAALIIEEQDATRAVMLCRRWSTHAHRFGNEVGGYSEREHQHQQRVSKALSFVQSKQRCSRSEIIKHLRLPSSVIDEIERDLGERGDIATFIEKTQGRDRKMWQAMRKA